MNKPATLAAAALLSLAALTGCGSTQAGSSAPASTSSTPAAGEPMEAPGADYGPAPTYQMPAGGSGAGFDRPAKFGETATFPDGVEVTVKANRLREVTEDDFVVVQPGSAVAEFTIEVTNKSGARLDAQALGDSDIACGKNFEGDGSLLSNPHLGAIFPGETKKGKFERIIQRSCANQVRVSVTDPSYIGQAAVFEGPVK